jgi:RNA polymerase sigma factor (TIGR02999 family)
VSTPQSDVTRVLLAWASGEPGAVDELIPLVYDELKQLARRQLARSSGARTTLDTTSLVHEAYLKFVDQAHLGLDGRSHFYAVAARAMRQVLVDRARRRQAAKRGGGVPPTELDDGHGEIDTDVEAILALEEALARLGAESERCVRVVECRFFAGLTEEETAKALGVSIRTIQRDWLQARAWLRQELSPAYVERLS